MKKRDLYRIGFEGDEVIREAIIVCSKAGKEGIKKSQLKKDLKDLVDNPKRYENHSFYDVLAKAVINQKREAPKESYTFNEDLKYNAWGEDIDHDKHETRTEVKAMTYADLRIEFEKDTKRIWFTLDL